jgi:hypothetical protein
MVPAQCNIKLTVNGEEAVSLEFFGPKEEVMEKLQEIYSCYLMFQDHWQWEEENERQLNLALEQEAMEEAAFAELQQIEEDIMGIEQEEDALDLEPEYETYGL